MLAVAAQSAAASCLFQLASSPCPPASQLHVTGLGFRVCYVCTGECFTGSSSLMSLLSPSSFTVSPPVGPSGCLLSLSITTPQLQSLSPTVLQRLEDHMNNSSNSKSGSSKSSSGCCCLVVHPDGNQQRIDAAIRKGKVEISIPPIFLEVCSFCCCCCCPCYCG